MFTIHLQKLQFQSFHGCQPEEKIIGNQFEVDAKVSVPSIERVDKIEQTIDYVSIYSIIKSRMAIPTPLLETICQDIITDLQQQFPQIETIHIHITKVNPPLIQFEGSLAVSLDWKK